MSSLRRDAHNSAASRQIVEKQPRMHFDKAGLFALLRTNGIVLQNVESIQYLGNRIACIVGGQQFVLR